MTGLRNYGDEATNPVPLLPNSHLDDALVDVQVTGGSATTLHDYLNVLTSSSGASLVGTIAAGTGAVARTEQDKLRKDIAISPEDYGAVGNGVTDDGTALTNFFNDLLSNTNLEGRMLPKIYASSISLPNINISGFTLRGFGPAGSHNVGSLDIGTVIKAIAGNTGTMLTIAPTEGASAQYLTGVRMIGITFDCNSIATKGLVTKSMRYCDLDFTVLNAVTTGWEMNVSTTLGEVTSSQRNHIRYVGRQQEAAAGVSLQLLGTASGNPSFNIFEYVDIIHKDALGIIEANADNNRWMDVRVTQVAGGAAVNSIEWRGGATSGQSCRSEEYFSLSTTLAPIAKGTGTYTVGAQNIRILSLDKTNNTPDPTVETGATAYWQNDSTPIYNMAWTQTTPTPTPGAGAFVTASATVRALRVANGVHYNVNVSITDNGTGSTGFVRCPLPYTHANNTVPSILAGKDTFTSKGLSGIIAVNTAYVDIAFLAAAFYPGANGANLCVSGFAEL